MLRVTAPIIDFFETLPEVNKTWQCKWFRAVLVVSTLVLGVGIVSLPGTVATLAIVASSSSIAYVIGVRDSGSLDRC